MRIGIVGYGNLGKAVEKYCIENPLIDLVGIYSRRNVKTLSENTLPFNDTLKPIDADVLILCGGSAGTLSEDCASISKFNNVIDAYDNHSDMNKHIADVKINQNPNKLALIACGWDPGIFSIIRSLSFLLPESDYITLWGKGISQGHTQAIKQIEGVTDGIQYTIPYKKLVNRFKRKGQKAPSNLLHRRLCLVACKRDKRKDIKFTILNMPNYFKGYKVKIKFVSLKKLQRVKEMYHGGEVIAQNKVSQYDFKLKTNSNPSLTAGILVKLAFVLKRMHDDGIRGTLTMLDIPPKYYIEGETSKVL